MKQIDVGDGLFALVDDEDYERVSALQWKWYMVPNNHNLYARSKEKHFKLMHRFVLGFDADDPIVDHKDRNGLNNQKHNLREASNQQNVWNSDFGYNECKFTGIQLTTAGTYRARINNDGRRIDLGSFKTAIEAAKMYDLACLLYRGEFAVTNGDKGNYVDNFDASR